MLIRDVLAGLCFLAAACAHQDALAGQPGQATKAGDRYAKEAAVVEHLETVYRYAADGTGTRQMTMALRVQSEAAVRQFGVVSLQYASANEHIEFDYARVRRPDGSVVETPVGDAQEIAPEVTRQAPFYSDIKEKQLPMRSLRVGDTLEYQARVVRTKAESPGEMWGAESLLSNVVVLDQAIELRLPAGKEVTVWSPQSKPVIKEEGGERIYRWTGSHLEPTVGPEADAKREADKTRVVSAAEADDLQFGVLPTVAWTSFKSWDAVGTWYRTLEEDRLVSDSDVKAKVVELLAGKKTDEEKVRALYSYVSTNVRYIGVALGVGRYQPHPASEVLRNQYGDCKDKHTLLAAMLLQAGFKPSAVLVGVGIRFNPDVPSPAAFNHLITQLPVDGKTIWLDSTQEVAPYRALLAVVRDKDALVVPSAGLSRTERTPATLPYPSIEQFEAIGTLSPQGIADSHFVITARGDDELVFRSIVHQFSPGQYDDFVQKLSQNLGFAGTTTHAEISRPEATDDPVRIAYDYKREKPGDWDSFRITPQIPPISMVAPDEKDPPKTPIDLGLPRVETTKTALKLPDGWGATLPKATHVKTPFALYDKTYRLDKGTLYADRRLEILEEKIPAADWKSFKKFTDDISLGTEAWVQLTSTGKRSSGPMPPAPAVSDEAAAKLIQQALAEMQSHQMDTAQIDLDQAKKINEQQAYLWSSYAFLSFSQGKASEAIAAYKKELALHPDELQMYGPLAQMQLGMGQRKDAEATLRTRLTDGGPEAATSLQLAQMLSEDDDSAGAVSILEGANKALPNDPRIELALGRAEIQAGKVQQGTSLLKAVIEGPPQGPGGQEPDAAVLNDAAFQLAEANSNLKLADRTIRKALALLAAESSTLTPDADPRVAVAKTQMAVAAWDTLGWTLFREHKFAEAEPYLRAAWVQGQHPDVGLHLGELEEANGHLDAALTIYSYAAGASFRYGMDGVRMAPSATAKELDKRIAAVRAKGAKSVVPAGGQIEIPGKTITSVERGDGKGAKTVLVRKTITVQNASDDLRTVSLGSAKGVYGTREFTLILSAAGIAAEKGSENKPALKGDEEMVHRLSTKEWWPADSPLKLYRMGVLNCHEDKCEFRYYPL